MTTDGIEGLMIETHNWGKTVAFWKALGYELQFETDHHSGMLRHPKGGPYLFVAERAPGTVLELHPVLGVRDPASFTAPTAGTVIHPFEPQHWHVLEMRLGDPDGRHVSVQAPLPAGAKDKGHHG